MASLETIVLTILQAEAFEYLGRAHSGRSRPMQCRCETEDGDEISVYVKYSDFHEDLSCDFLTCELVANQYAVDLGLPAAKPCLVRISPEFVETLPFDKNGESLRAAFGRGNVIAFGSSAFPTTRRWTPENLVHKGQMAEAASLYLFDTLVENSDRGVSNPNLLISGDSFQVIDFGHCFQRCHSEADFEQGNLPWQHFGIWNNCIGDLQHVLFNNLKGRCVAGDIDAFTTSLTGLSDDTIEDYVNIVPEEWGQDVACKIVDYLIEARARADDFNQRVKEVLL